MAFSAFSRAPIGIGLGQAVSQRELLRRRGEWKSAGEEVVCAYGAFDLLHPGHIRLLEQARDFGEVLVVAVQSDEEVRAAALCARANAAVAPGGRTDRPITPAAERAEILAALNAVDCAAIADQPLAEFLEKLRPDVFICGDESDGRSANPRDLEFTLAEIGCKLARVPLEPGYSTSRLIERISRQGA